MCSLKWIGPNYIDECSLESWSNVVPISSLNGFAASTISSLLHRYWTNITWANSVNKQAVTRLLTKTRWHLRLGMFLLPYQAGRITLST